MFDSRCDCLTKTVISIIIGIIVGYVFSIGALTGIAILLWIALGIAGVSLITLITIATFSRGETDKCICINGDCLLLGIFSTLILSIIALSLTLTVGILSSAILVGAVGAALALTIISIANFLCCLIRTKCKCMD